MIRYAVPFDPKHYLFQVEWIQQGLERGWLKSIEIVCRPEHERLVQEILNCYEFRHWHGTDAPACRVTRDEP